MVAMDEELKTARVLLDMLADQAEQTERALLKIAEQLKDEALALAVISQAKALRLGADEAKKLVELIRERA